MTALLQFALFSNTARWDASVKFTPSSVPHPMSWVSDTVITYRPFCGKHLESWYGNQLKEFSRTDLAIREHYE